MADDWAEIGDLNIGATMTFGFPHVGGTSDEWFLSDFLVVWMMNPSVTQMPDAHFLYEARYNGAELCVVDPQYTRDGDACRPVAADRARVPTRRWASRSPATSGDSGRIDLPYVREQTDLPLLVRLDTRPLPARGGSARGRRRRRLMLYWDPAHRPPGAGAGLLGLARPTAPRPSAASSRRSRAASPVTLADGTAVAWCRSARCCASTSSRGRSTTPREVTGLAPEQISAFADGFAHAKRPMVLSSWGSNRYFHSDHMNRAKILCLTLKGAIGRKGAGYHSTGWVGIEGFDDA